MKRKQFAALSTIVLMGAGIAVLVAAERGKARKKRALIADAGYETAHDILFPKKAGSRR
jgi:hypothetical protein